MRFSLTPCGSRSFHTNNIRKFRALYLHHLMSFQKAVDACNRALQIDPNFVGAYNNLAYAFTAKGDFQKAVDACNRALQLDPNFVGAFNNIAYAYEGLGQLKKTLEACDKGLKIDPSIETLNKLKDRLSKSNS